MRVLQGHQGTVKQVLYAPTGQLLSGGDDGVIRIWNPATWTLEGTLEGQTGIEALALTPAGDLLLAGLSDEHLVLWDWPQGKQVASVQNPFRAGTRCLALAPDRLALLLLGWDRILLCREGVSWSKALKTRPRPFPIDRGTITHLAFRPDGSLLAIPTWEGDTYLVDSRSGKVKETLPSEEPVQTVAFSPDGKFLATGEQMGQVVAWEVDRAFDPAFLDGHEWVVFALTFTPNSTALISGGADGTIRVWDVAGWKQRECFRWTGQCVTCLAVSPDGMTAAAGGAGGSLVVWDLADP